MSAPMPTGLSVSLKCLWWWQPLFYLSRPVLVINGQPQAASWGVQNFPLPPGRYQVRIFFPYLTRAECGAATADVSVEPDRVTRITYSTPFTMFQAGKIRVQSG